MDLIVFRVDKRPPKWDYVCDLLRDAGVKYFTLFGGAVRDADLGRPISDYDVRIWLPEENFETELHRFLLDLPPGRFKIIPCPGSTTKVRYVLELQHLLLDISVRPYTGTPSIYAPAHAQIMKANAGISAIAMDPRGTVWCRPEYVQDKTNQTITMLHAVSQKTEQYQKRLQEKFPSWKVIPPMLFEQQMRNKA